MVRSASGSVTIAVDVSADITPGVVSLPHGWGHDGEGMRVGVAARFPGINTNVLSPGDLLDEVSNNAVLNGMPPVEVVAAADAAPMPVEIAEVTT